MLTENRVNRARGSDAKHPSLLVGLAFDENGERLTPSHAVKKGTRYRYYVWTSLITGAAKDRSKGRRMPAANLKTLVITRLQTLLADRGAILDAIQNEYPGACHFAEATGKQAAIGALKDLKSILRGEAGTTIAAGACGVEWAP